MSYEAATEANTNSLVTNLNVDPYYDDFDESKNFHRILFRPGFSVQARELTQLQSILQNQIDRFGSHIFKEGSPVRGLEIHFQKRQPFVRVKDVGGLSNVSANVYSLESRNIRGLTNRLTANVVIVNDGSEANTPNLKTLYVNYTSGNNTTRFFADNEVIEWTANTTNAANVQMNVHSTGSGSRITVGSGIIFAKDHFIRVAAQDLILDKYSTNASYRVGYNVIETVISDLDDSTLQDPAQGAYNYTAPGANRLKLNPILTKVADGTTASNNFVELIKITNGRIEARAAKPQYAAIRDYMAERTFDESGNYIVRGLQPRIREHLKTGNNQGVFVSSPQNAVIRGQKQTGNNELLVVEVQPGKAYVKGYDNELYIPQNIIIDKGIDFEEINDAQIFASYGNYVDAHEVVGNWDTINQKTVTLRDTQHKSTGNGTFSTTVASGASLGTARVRDVVYVSGTPGSSDARYRIHLTDVKITATDKTFADVKGLHYDANTGFSDAKASVYGTASLSDSEFNRAVFRLPAKSIKTLRDSSNSVDTNYTFQKEFDFSFNSAGAGTINSTVAAETFVGSGTLSDSRARDNFYVVLNQSANTGALTGTLKIDNGSGGAGNTVVGVGTRFDSQLNVGDIISTNSTNQFTINEITSNTAAKILGTGLRSAGTSFYKRLFQGQVVDMGGVGMQDAQRTVTVNSTTQVALDIQETLNSPSSITATALVRMAKTNVQEATKSIARNRLVELNLANNAAYGTSNLTGPWNLGVSDVFRIVSVRRKTGSFFSATTDGSDVTNDFILDPGQKDNYYDHGKLELKNSSTLSLGATDRLLVTLDFFTHANRDRGYFNFQSYPVDDSSPTGSNISTQQVPIFKSKVTGQAFDLRDCIDFRPRITDTANSVTALTNISRDPATSTTFDEPAGGLDFPSVDSTFSTDLSYYLKRTDLITMDKDGIVDSVRGISSLDPKTPPPPSDRIVLSEVYVAQYPSLPDEIARRNNRSDYANGFKTIKNERFTMKDIGTIRDRVDRLEYFTTLSLLEQQAKEQQLKDGNGIDRFKNGFIVDPMTGHNVGNPYDQDYSIAIDPAKREARPKFELNNIELFYNAANSTNIVRTNVTTAGVSRDQRLTINTGTFSNGEAISDGSRTGTLRFQNGTGAGSRMYIEGASGNFPIGATLTGGSSGETANVTAAQVTTPGRVMTLPYTHDLVQNQPFATSTRNLAGLFYSWQGTITLTPNDDYWVDTVEAPEVQINLDNNSDNWLVLAEAWGTQWGDWETVAVGAPTAVGSPVQITSGGRIENGNFVQDAFEQQQFVTTTTSQAIGTQLSVSLGQQTQSMGSVVKDVNLQPFMRAREIKFEANALKPNTKVYPFFNDQFVGEYATQTNSSFANTKNEGSSLVTDSDGNLYGLFRIPNNQQLRFRVGEKIFRLTDSPRNGKATTAAEATYAAQGLITTTQETTIGTTVAELTVDTVDRTQTSSTVETITRPAGQIVTELPQPPPPPVVEADGTGDDWGDWDFDGWDFDGADDPISQTFLVNTFTEGNVASTSAFLTKIDLFFATKHASLPVIVEIREVDQLTGYPMKRLVPHGRAIVPAADINVSDDGKAVTPVYFKSPIHLQDGRQYCFVIKPGGNNPDTSIWIAELGENDINTGERVSKQPFSGMMFASSNDLTYTPLQEEDMKCNIYYADFGGLNQTGTLIMKNEDKDFLTIANQTGAFIKAGEKIHGETYLKGTFVPGNGATGNVASGNTYVQGMVSGATGEVTYLSAANNELRMRNVSTAAQFKGGEAIRFRVGASATASPITGNSTGGVTSAIYPFGKVSYYNNKGTSTYLHLANVATINSGPTTSNGTLFFDNRWIKGQANGYIAYITDLHELNADVINFKTDYFTPANTSITMDGKFGKASNTRDTSYIRVNNSVDTVFNERRKVYSFSQEEANTQLAGGTAEIRIGLTSNNRLASPVFDTQRLNLTLIENLVNANSTVAASETNVKSGGTALARYITRRVTLKEDQDAEDLKVFLDAYMPPSADVQVFYKVLSKDDSDTFEEAKWHRMAKDTANTIFSSNEARNDFVELEFSMPAYGSENAGLFANTTFNSTANVLHYRNSDNVIFDTYKHFAVKVVLTSSDSTNVPRFRNFRAIALQK